MAKIKVAINRLENFLSIIVVGDLCEGVMLTACVEVSYFELSPWVA